VRIHRYHVVVVLIGVLALVVGVFLGRLFTCGGGPCRHGAGGVVSEQGLGGESGTAVEIAGGTTWAIAPGTDAPLNLQLTNRNSFAMSTHHLRVSVQSVTAPRSSPRRPCTAADFTVTQAAPGLEITLPAHGSMTLLDHPVRRTAWPRVAMVNAGSNQDGCQQATLALLYTASGTRVEQ
jgi:hypothetical protein